MSGALPFMCGRVVTGSRAFARAAAQHAKRQTGSLQKCGGSGRNSAGDIKITRMFDRDAPTPYIGASDGEEADDPRMAQRQTPRPWFAAIADNGQNRFLPYAPVNAQSVGGSCLTTRASCYPTNMGGDLSTT